MSRIVAPFGLTPDITIPAGQAIAIYSQGPSQLLVAGLLPPAQPAANFNVYADIPAGSPQYVSPTFTNGGVVRVQSFGFDTFWEIGLTPSVKQLRLQSPVQVAPIALNATGALTAAMILNGQVTSTTAAAVAGTLPTGTIMDSSSTFDIGDSVEFSVTATGANAFTVTAATGHTVEGNAVVATATTGQFRTRKTAANTFVTSRIA